MSARMVRGALRGLNNDETPVNGVRFVPSLKTASVEDTAEYLGTTAARLKEMHRQGRGPTRRSDGSYLVWEVEEWAEGYRSSLIWLGRAA